MSEAGFGKVNLDSQYEGPKYFKMRTPKPPETETVLILRLLPSMHSYRDSGQWKFFYGQHYGHVGNNPRDPSKPRARPFGCIQKKNKLKEILTRCPKCDQIATVEAKKKAREAELAKAHGFESEEQLKSPEFYEVKKNDRKYQDLAGWLSKHNCDKKFWINAMDRDGNCGMLQLSYTTCEEKLMPLLRKLSKGEETGEPVDAFDPNGGMWLKFTRSGRAPRVVDTVTIYEELVDLGGGKKAKVAQPAPMKPEQIAKALKTCKDLSKDVVKMITAEQIQQLVNSSGDPDETDAIWPPEDKKATEAKAAATPSKLDLGTPEGEGDDGESLVDEDLTPPPATTTTVTTETTKTIVVAPGVKITGTVTETVTEDDEEAAALKAYEAAKAKKAAAKAAATKTEAPAMGAAVDDPDKFLSQFDAK